MGEITLGGVSLKVLDQDEVRKKDRSCLTEQLFLQYQYP